MVFRKILENVTGKRGEVKFWENSRGAVLLVVPFYRRAERYVHFKDLRGKLHKGNKIYKKTISFFAHGF
jgi:hypothetical protein